MLILLDLNYLGRFWTQFEAWLAFQACTVKGIEPRRLDGDDRPTIEPIHNANSTFVQALENLWHHITPSDAHAVLSKPDVRVTNESDKELQLPKIMQLAGDVKAVRSSSRHQLQRMKAAGHAVSANRRLGNQQQV